MDSWWHGKLLFDRPTASDLKHILNRANEKRCFNAIYIVPLAIAKHTAKIDDQGDLLARDSGTLTDVDKSQDQTVVIQMM